MTLGKYELESGNEAIVARGNFTADLRQLRAPIPES